MMLPPRPRWCVVVTHLVGKETFKISAWGDSEAECLCILAKREPDGSGICTDTFVGMETFVVPQELAP